MKRAHRFLAGGFATVLMFLLIMGVRAETPSGFRTYLVPDVIDRPSKDVTFENLLDYWDSIPVFRQNQAAKHPDNPVVIPGYPHEWDSLQINWPSAVIYDPEDKLFRLYYHGRDVVQYDVDQYPELKPFESWLGRLWRAGYAESKDGINWDKPPLGQYSHRDSPTNAIMTDYEKSGTGKGWDHFTTFHGIWLNPSPRSPEERFLAIFSEIGSDERGFRSFKEFRKVVYSSADGKRWIRGQVAYEAPSIRDEVPSDDVIDTNSVIQEPDHPNPDMRVKAYGQTGKGGRGVGLVYGKDFQSLTPEGLTLVMQADQAIETEIHWSSVSKLQNGYYIMVFDSNRFSYDGSGVPEGSIHMAVSDDGVSFRRIDPGSPLIPRGSKGMWDSNQLVSSSVVEFGDEVYIYYHGTPIIYRPWPATPPGVPYTLRASNVYPSYLGVAVLPRDRFYYLEGNGKDFLTKPFRVAQDTLWINAEGEVGVALETESGGVVATGTPSGATRQTVYRLVEWDDSVPEGEYRIRFTLAPGARLFSIQIGA